MKVTLMNKEEVKNLYKQWGTFSSLCYDTKEGKEEFVGKHCHSTGHYSGSRSVNFVFKVEGVSRVCTAQMNRHSVGVTINEQSMRYVNFENAEIKVPHTIERNEKALEEFNKAVETCKQAYKNIQELLEEDGLHGEEVNQDARYILPIGVETKAMYGFTLEALEHFCNKRLCLRSQWEIREVARAMAKEVLEVLPELEKYLIPECKKLMYCPEGKQSCGMMPTKKEVKEILDKNKNK